MAAAVRLRDDFDAERLRALARGSKDGPQARRLLALAAIYEGGARSEAAKIGGVTLQIVRDWVLRFNAHGPDGLLDRKAPGQPSLLKDEHRTALAAHGRGRTHSRDPWRRALADRRPLPMALRRSSASLSPKRPMSRELRKMGYRKLSARPRHHAQARRRHRGVQKNFPARLEEIAREKCVDARDIEIWFADEARIGQKNKITRRWAKRGSRPSAPRDQRTASTEPPRVCRRPFRLSHAAMAGSSTCA